MIDVVGPVISEASVSDAAEISELAIKTYSDAFGADMAPDDLALHVHRTLSLANWVEYFKSDRVLVVRVGGAAVGYIQFGASRHPGAIDVRRVYVDETHQGQGLGSLMLRQVRDMPEVASAPAVYIDVWEDNAGARRLYERFSFRHEGEKVPFILRSGEVEGYDLVLVRRPGPA